MAKTFAPAGTDLLPSARLVVGLTGHRSNRLAAAQMAALERTLASLLGQLEGCRAALQRDLPSEFRTAHGGTVVVSMLASGADTLGARAALALGFELQAVLPFPRERYRLDFLEAEEQEEFDRLCAATTRLLSVSGPAGEPDAAGYERGGFLLVAAADVLVAVWDGEEARGRGGTAAVVQCALDCGRPVLTIHPDAPDEIALIWPDRIAEQAETTRATDARRCPALPLLPAVVNGVLAPPLDESATDLRDLLLGRRRPNRWVRFEYPLLLALIGIRRFRRSDLPLPDAGEQARQDWAALSAGLGPAASGPAPSAGLTARIAAADHLANYYARVWRGSFVSRYAFAAGLAVGSGVAGALNPAWRTFLFMTGAALNGFVLLDGWLADRWEWRERWLKCRYLAERLRQVRIAHLLGVEPVRAGSRSGAAELWVDWYVRRTARDLGIPALSFDDATIGSTAAAISGSEFRGQCDYHRAAAAFATRVDKRLGLFSKLCFAGTVVAGIGYGAVAVSPYELSLPLDQILSALFAILPALGSAVAAVRAQGDFPRLADRSTAVADELDRLIGILAAPGLSFDRLRRSVERAMRTMDKEAGEWKAAAEHRNLQNA